MIQFKNKINHQSVPIQTTTTTTSGKCKNIKHQTHIINKYKQTNHQKRERERENQI